MKVERTPVEDYADYAREVYNIGIPFSNNIEVVLEKMGGKLEILEPEGWCHSKLYFRTATWESKFTIRVSPTLRKESRNYEIARQLGHLFLHTTYLNDEIAVLFIKDVSDPEYGMQANEFANALMMPRKDFTEEVYKNIENDRVKIRNVAEKFGVTYETAMVRAKELKLIQC